MPGRDAYFDAGLRGWLKTTAVAEHWRVASWYDVDDLVQDGYICYIKCRDRYTFSPPMIEGYQDLRLKRGHEPNKTQRQHFMSLVQRAFRNHVHTLSCKYPVLREQPLSDVVREGKPDEPVTMEELVPVVPEEISALYAIVNAPTEIGEAIVKLVNDGVDGSKYLRSRLRSRDGRIKKGRLAIRETTEEHHTRILGDPFLADETLKYILS